jgi:outer membrane protein assembly factor BamD (BamD/ComL family)
VVEEAVAPQAAVASQAVAPSQGVAPSTSSSSAHVPSPAQAPNDSLGELRAIAAARNLVDRDPDAALAALEAIRRDHPNGYFVEERQALTILALAGAGKTAAARTQAADFLRAHPNGPYSDRMRAILHSQ